MPEGEMPETPGVETAPEQQVNEPVYSLTFTIRGTRAQLKAAAQYIKEYLNREGLRYE